MSRSRPELFCAPSHRCSYFGEFSLKLNGISIVRALLLSYSIDTTWKFQRKWISSSAAHSYHILPWQCTRRCLQSELLCATISFAWSRVSFSECSLVLARHFNIIKSSADNHLILVRNFVSTTERRANSHATVCLVLAAANWARAPNTWADSKVTNN